MAELFTADPHFFHDSILKYCPLRPGSTLAEHHEHLIGRWNVMVKPGDRIYVLGDFCFKNFEAMTEMMGRMNGYKILVQGNHDRGFGSAKRLGFNEFYKDLVIELRGQKVLLSHYPYEHGQVDRHIEKYGPMFTHYNGLPLLCGHVHDAWKTFKVRKKAPMVNVGVDVWDCFPVTAEQAAAALFDA